MGWRIECRGGFRIELLAGEGAAVVHSFFVLWRGMRRFFVKKFEMVFADLDDIAVFEWVFFDGCAIDQGAVSTAAVFQDENVAHAHNGGCSPDTARLSMAMS